MKPEICIGTAQFGMNYGITNNKGKIELDEIRKILKFAKEKGIRFLDTARAYGDSEKNIGLNLKDKKDFNILTKISPNEFNVWNRASISIIDDHLKESLDKLKISKLDGILFHRSSDLLLKGNKYLFRWIDKIISQGLVNKVGVSIYESFELDDIPLEIINIVQLPLSIYDQRMIKSGMINMLKEKGISIHARSVFLQGLLLEMGNLPLFFSEDFRNHHQNFINFCNKNNISLLDGALSFISGIKELEAVIFGISCKKDLVQIYDSFYKINSFSDDLKNQLINFDWKHIKDLDPRTWTG